MCTHTLQIEGCCNFKKQYNLSRSASPSAQQTGDERMECKASREFKVLKYTEKFPQVAVSESTAA